MSPHAAELLLSTLYLALQLFGPGLVVGHLLTKLREGLLRVHLRDLEVVLEALLLTPELHRSPLQPIVFLSMAILLEGDLGFSDSGVHAIRLGLHLRGLCLELLALLQQAPVAFELLRLQLIDPLLGHAMNLCDAALHLVNELLLRLPLQEDLVDFLAFHLDLLLDLCLKGSELFGVRGVAVLVHSQVVVRQLSFQSAHFFHQLVILLFQRAVAIDVTLPLLELLLKPLRLLPDRAVLVAHHCNVVAQVLHLPSATRAGLHARQALLRHRPMRHRRRGPERAQAAPGGRAGGGEGNASAEAAASVQPRARIGQRPQPRGAEAAP
mmetsp:Transcript_7575/g.28560  ORF Transcript_7575/g.28560 Transcript_7575/m.28560 type:complete len:324 (-) Transcript_7575:63-1034(-)